MKSKLDHYRSRFDVMLDEMDERYEKFLREATNGATADGEASS